MVSEESKESMVYALTLVRLWRGLLVQHAKEWFIAKH
jgi:hypothetical protein